MGFMLKIKHLRIIVTSCQMVKTFYQESLLSLIILFQIGGWFCNLKIITIEHEGDIVSIFTKAKV